MRMQNAHSEILAAVPTNELGYVHCPIAAIFRAYRKRRERQGVQVHSIVPLDRAAYIITLRIRVSPQPLVPSLHICAIRCNGMYVRSSLNNRETLL